VTVAFAVTTENRTDLPATFDAIVTVDPEAAKLEQSLATADGTPFVVHVPLAEPCRANCTITVVAAPDGTFTDPNLENNVARVLPPVLE
jgi:hypothetical protein